MSKKRSLVHPKYKTLYRVRNWGVYDRALVRRGDLTIWFDEAAISAWELGPQGAHGRPRVYPALAPGSMAGGSETIVPMVRRARHRSAGRSPLFLFGVTLALLGTGACDDERPTVSSGRWRNDGPPTSTPPAPKFDIPKYFVASEEVYDSPNKTQIEQHIVVPEVFWEANLKALLKQLYETASARTGFKHRRSPNAVYIFAYESPEHAKSGMGQWFARLSKAKADAGPTVAIDWERFERMRRQDPGAPAKASGKKEKRKKRNRKFGLSEAKRRKIFTELVRLEDKGSQRAERRYPNIHLHYAGQDLWDMTIKKGDYEERLHIKAEKKIAKKYKLTVKQVGLLKMEAVRSNWPFPEQ